VRRVGVLIWGTVVVLFSLTASGETAAPSQRQNLAVVALESRIGGDLVRASGTVVDADGGLVLTSAHSVWGATSLKVATALGIMHGRIVARAPCDDLALVELQPRVPGLVALDPAPQSPPDGLLTAVGRRRSDPDGGATSLLAIPARAEPAGDVLRLDTPLVPEASGGPILDRDDRVVAMATGAGVALPWAAVRRLLDKLEPGPRRVYVGWRSQYRCAERLHRAMLESHPGYRRADARLNPKVPATRLTGTEELDR
jgi:S1-C subfamily serine protease